METTRTVQPQDNLNLPELKKKLKEIEDIIKGLESTRKLHQNLPVSGYRKHKCGCGVELPAIKTPKFIPVPCQHVNVCPKAAVQPGLIPGSVPLKPRYSRPQEKHKPKVSLTTVNENRIIYDYQHGKTVAAICKKYNTSPGEIYRCLHRHNIMLLRKHGQKVLR